MFDIVIVNGTCYKGDGSPGVQTDVGIKDGRIKALGSLDTASAGRVVDAAGLAVTPGFIDTHSHSDLVALVEPEIANKTTQGVTTDIIGQDGMSLAPITDEYVAPWRKTMAGLEGNYQVDWTWRTAEEYLKALDAQPLGPNLAWLAPYSNLRLWVSGLGAEPLNDKEIQAMKDLLEGSIAAGAVGISTGLIYPPCSYASTDELAQVASVLAKYDLPFVTHQRSEADDILNSMDEIIAIGRQAGCPIHFSHFKLCGMKNAHLFDQVMQKLDKAAEELKVSVDQYPYTAGSTTFSVILPPWVHDGGTEKAMARLADPEARQRMKRDITQGIPGWDNFVDFAGMDNIFVTFVKNAKNADMIGKSMVEMGEMKGKDPLDASFDLLLEEEMSVGLVDFYGLEEHVETILAHPLQNVCTDGILGSHPHPRVYGTFPKVLGHYVGKRKILDLPTAIYKMTGRPASVFKLKDRGLLKEGYWADITIFDPEKVMDRATYEKPIQYSQGVSHVLAGGVFAVDEGKITRAPSGRVVRFEK